MPSTHPPHPTPCSNWLDEEEGDEEAATRPATKVEVDLALSAHANARVYYDSRRKHQARLGQLVASEGQPCG
jgi:hypothetical protein